MFNTILDADHPFIAPGPDDQRGRKFISQFAKDNYAHAVLLHYQHAVCTVIDMYDHSGCFILLSSWHEHTRQPWLHPQGVCSVLHSLCGYY